MRVVVMARVGLEHIRRAATRREATMSKAPRRVDHDRKLSRVIVLRGGTRLVTLKDAADVPTERFAGVRKRVALEHCIELLMQAGTTGWRSDIRAATAQLEIVLRAQQLL